MPAAIPLIAGAFLAAGTVATALGVTAVAFTVAGLAVSWAAVATITGVALMGVAMLSMKRPKPGSSGGQLDSKLDVRAPIPVAYGRTATGGYITYQQSWGKKNSLLALVAVLSAGPVAAIETHKASDSTVYYSGNPSTGLATSVGVGDGSKLYKNKLRQRFQLGEAPASQTVTQASGLPLPGSPGKLSGLAHTISVLEYNTDAFPQGVPKNLWVLRGVKLYDPRKDSTFPGGSGSHRRDNHLTWEYSENPYLAALDWTFGRWWNGKKVYGIGARFEEVDVAAFVNGANVADANGWKIGGVVTTADNKFAVLSTILQSGGGVPTARGAQLSCTVNAPKTATFTLTSQDIIGEVEIVNTTTWRDRSNTVVPSYREESQLWAMIAGEQVSSDVHIAEDAGERKTIEVDYPLVQQAAQAHQLATYELCNSREFLTFTVTAKVRALNVRVGDAITVNIPEVAAVSKKCVVISREFNPGDLSVSLTLKSETDDKHPFALGQSQVAPPAPALNGYNPSAPGAPDATAWSATGGEITAQDGSKMPAIIIAGETDDPNASNVIVEYRPAGSSVWLAGGDYPATARTIELTSVTAQTLYDVALRYRTVRGVVSEPLLMSATAGAQKVNWATVVTGVGKPEDGATKGAPVGTNVGSIPVTDIVAKLGTLDSYGLTDTLAPAIPTGLALTSVLTDAGVTLRASWNTVTAADLAGYVIAIKQGSGGYVEFQTGSNAYERTALARNTSVTAKVAAYDRAGNRSGWSSEVAITTARDTVAPAKPSQFGLEAAFTTVSFVMSAPADADLDFVKVRMFNGAGAEIAQRDLNAVPGARLSTVFTGLTKGTTYQFSAESYDTSLNTSGQSDKVSITTAAGIDLNDFTPGLRPVGDVATLPPAAGYSGPNLVFNRADGKLYRYTNGQWKSDVDAIDTSNFVTNQNLSNYKIGENNLSVGIIKSENLVRGSVSLDKIGSDFTIGSANLVRNSNGLGPRWYFGPNNSYVLPAGFAPYNNAGDAEPTEWSMHDGAGWSGATCIAVRFSNNASTKGVYLANVSAINNGDIMKANRTYTVSFYSRASGGALGKGFSVTYNSHPAKNIPVKNPPLTNQYQRYVFRQEWGNTVDPAMYVTVNSAITNTESVIDFSDFQIEEGSIVSAYSPALIPGEIGGAYLAAKAITRDKIADAAIGTNQIESLVAGKISGTIAEVQIGDDTVSAPKIKANAVTADKVAANAITADKIAANSIAANKLTISTRPFALYNVRFAVGNDGRLTWNDGYVQYVKADGTYVSEFVAAGAISPQFPMHYLFYYPNGGTFGFTQYETIQSDPTAFMVAQWNGTKFGLTVRSGVGTLINGDQIITGSIYAEKIVAATITGDKIAGSTILAGNIAADAITADKIKSNSIRATHLAIGSFDQLNPDPTFRDETFWYNNGVYNGKLSPGQGDYRGWYNIHGADIDSIMGYRTYCMLWSDAFPMAPNARQHLFSNTSSNIKPSTVYEISAQVRNSTNQYIHVYIRQLRSDDSYIGDVALSVPPGTTPTVFRKQFTSHAECQKYHFIIFNNADNALTGNAQVSDVQVVKASVGTTIADGVISTDKLSANAVTADKIAANSIAATKLTISTRPFALYNLRFGVGNDGKLSWGSGYVQYVKSDGTYNSEPVAGGTISSTVPMHYLYYAPGSGVIGISAYETNQADANVFQVGQWNGTKSGLTVHGGVGTIINGDQILTGSVHADRITARTISADKIASGAITSNEIAANTIAANRLTVASRRVSVFGMRFRVDNDGYLRWGSGYVQFTGNEGQYISQYVEGNQLGPGSATYYLFLTPDGRQYFDYTTDEGILNNNNVIIIGKWHNNKAGFVPMVGVGTLVNGDQIITGSVNADRLIANSVTANQIAAGTITAAQIATSAITARTIALGNPDNVVTDGDFRDPAWWNSNANDARLTVQEIGFPTMRRCLALRPGGGIDVMSSMFPVEPGATYKVQTSVYLDSNFSGSFGAYIHMPGAQWFSLKSGDGRDPTLNQADTTFRVAGQSWHDITHIVTNPSINDCRQWQFRLNGSWTGAAFFAVRIVRVSDSTLIRDGAITTDKITVNSLNGDRILAGSLEADKIKANAISANQLSLGLQSRVINNIVNTSFWGTGAMTGQPHWTPNNDSANFWAHIISPGGGSERALRMVANTDNNANGGWNLAVPVTEGFSPDKAYRYYTWYFAENDGKNNSIYHGCDTVQHMAGGNADNPYFFSFTKSQLQRGKWYLLVGLVHPRNTGAGISGISGVYDPVTGQRVIAGTDYRWRPDAVSGGFRSYQYYGDVGGVAWFTKPVVEEVVQGQTPSIKSLMSELDYGSVVNAGSTLIRPGLLQITGGTTLESWKNGTDSTEIRGGAIAANTITAGKITLGNRGISFLGLNFEWNPSNNYVSWSEGYILHMGDNGERVSNYINGGNSGGVNAHRMFYWVRGESTIRMTTSLEETVGDDRILVASWWGGSNLNANYGGTIIHGDRITTGTINANRIVAGSVLANSIVIGDTGSTLAQSLTKATWAGVTGTGKPADGATVGAPTGTMVANKRAEVLISELDNMLSDNVISRAEKPELITRWQGVERQWAYVRDTSLGFGLSVADLDASRNALSDYLSNLSPGWSDLSADTSVDGRHLSNLFYNLEVNTQDRARENARKAATLASWGGVTGTGKPADNATVGAPTGTLVGNTLAQNVESYATDPANRINNHTTTISGGKITTGSIEANKINVSSLSAISANVGTVTAGLVRSTSGEAYFDLDNARIVFNKGGVMKVQGSGFGSSNQFIEWFGPTQSDFASCTESNATYYLKTNGAAYFGGSLSAGVIKNSVQTTGTAATATVSTGSFGSNGRPRTVVLSYSFNYSAYSSQPRSGGPGGISATISLRRNGTEISTLNVSGGWQVQVDNEVGGQYRYAYTEDMGGSVTVTDTSGGSSVEYSAVITARNRGPGPNGNIQVYSEAISQNISLSSVEQ